MSAIRIGVAGWDYPDWRGVVYPSVGARRLDRLAYLAQFVDVVEINSTFYSAVRPQVAASWAERTRATPGLRFTAKTLRALTHDPAADPRAAATATARGLEPLWSAGVLTALLVQFPQSFHHSAAARDRLAAVLDALPVWPIVVEVRHASWGSEDVGGWLRERGVGWCVVDQPRVGGATIGPVARVTAPLAYLRLHGRNAATWFRDGAGRDARYDYLYTHEEMVATAATARQLAATAREVVVVQNNHFRGQALVNAIQLRHLVEGRRCAAPPSLVTAYPELAALTLEPPSCGLF